MESIKLCSFACDAPSADRPSSSQFRPRHNPRISLFRRHRVPVRLSCRADLSPPPSTAATGLEKDEASQFAEAAKGANMVALSRRIFSDQLTPVVAYRCLVKEDEIDTPSFLFESVNHGPAGPITGRYSIVGAHPSIEILAKEHTVTVMDHDEGQKTVERADDPTEVPRRIMERWNPKSIYDLPKDVFCGGWIGYFSYDAVRYVERIKLPFWKAPDDDRNLHDIQLGLYNNLIVFDHVEKIVYVIHWVRVDRYASVEQAYREGKKNLNILLSKIQNINLPKLLDGCAGKVTRQFRRSLTKPTMSPEAYKKVVERAIEYIKAGDLSQIVLSQRFERKTFALPFEVYRSSRIVNPSPYMAYLQTRGCILVASSPEMLIRVKKGVVYNRALAGTTRRGDTEEEDVVLEQKMLKDKKEIAEHLMIVDLAIKDVKKVAKFGSVKFEDLMKVDRYSHVMHIRSTVTGELRENATCWDALRAAMPVGTVTGTPKERAMELIDELEVTRRGPYSGGFGGVSFAGDMELALALRTIVFLPATSEDNSREWLAHLQSGAGIVAESDPATELLESETKAAAPSAAIDLAESAFYL